MDLYLARDKNKVLNLFEGEPWDCEGTWVTKKKPRTYYLIELKRKGYEWVTYENSPIKVILTKADG
jgi:hypothetical protein